MNKHVKNLNAMTEDMVKRENSPGWALFRLFKAAQKLHGDKLTRPDFNNVMEALYEMRGMDKGVELRHAADMKAIKRWHEAGGDELTWPDHADLVIFLLEENKKLHDSLERQADNMAFILNHADTGRFYDKFCSELEEDRKNLKPLLPKTTK